MPNPSLSELVRCIDTKIEKNTRESVSTAVVLVVFRMDTIRVRTADTPWELNLTVKEIQE